MSAHTATFSALFNQTWDPDHWTYNLSETVTGPGRYSGDNQYGQAFTLTLVHWAPVDLSTLGLTQETIDTAVDRGVTLAGAVAILSTSLARVHLFGIIASRYDGNRRAQWTFMPTYYADPQSPLFQQLLISPDQGTVSPDDGFRYDIPTPQGVPENTDGCIDQAIAQYDNTVANCNNVYNTTVNGPFGCNATFNNAVNGALAAFDNCMKLATGAGATCLLICLAASGGWGFFFCGVGCLALVARMELSCAQTFNAAIAAANWARNACVAAASATHLACINTAIATRDACINNAEQVLIQQIAACPVE